MKTANRLTQRWAETLDDDSDAVVSGLGAWVVLTAALSGAHGDAQAELESALRVEDQIFRMTRERIVLYLADVDAKGAAEVLVRIFADFCEEFPSADAPDYEQRMLEVRPGLGPLSVKDVLTSVFGARDTVH